MAFWICIEAQCPHDDFQWKHVCNNCDTKEIALDFSRDKRCIKFGARYECQVEHNHVVVGTSYENPAPVDGK